MEYYSISDLINDLTSIKKEYGNLQVIIDGEVSCKLEVLELTDDKILTIKTNPDGME